MVLHSAVIEKFKSIKHVELISNGNHITLAGTNGTGKSAVVEAIMSCLLGKKVLPEDPVMHGSESSQIELNIGDEKNGRVLYTVSAKIKGDNFKIEVNTYTDAGHKMTISKPATFLESIITKDFIDPLNFTNQPGKKRIEMLYQLIPGLQESLKKLDDNYVNEQLKRTEINKEKARIVYDISQHPFTKDLPEEEIDPAQVLERLNSAETHNLKKTGLENSIEGCERDIRVTLESINNARRAIAGLKDQLEKMEEQHEAYKNQLTIQEDTLNSRRKELDEFVPEDVESIRAEMSTLSDTNKQIRSNIRHKELSMELAKKSDEFSDGLKRMKEIEQKKIEVFKNANMPVENLFVGDTDIMYPDPITGEVVNFESLSTGQKYRVAVGILSGFLPDPKNGIRCMIIQNVNDLDAKNYEAMLTAANDNNIQLLMHKTKFESENEGLEIIIDER